MNKKLNDFSEYRNDRIECTSLTSENYVSVDNMLKDRGGISKSNYVPTSGFTQSFNKNDILIGNIRPYFKKIWLAENDGGCSADVLVIKPNAGVDPYLLYSILSSDHFFDYNMAGSKGSKMPRGDKSHIMSYPINTELSKNKIGELIYNINKKISLNNLYNEQIEGVINHIYKYWFNQFEFPDENGNPFKSSGGMMYHNTELNALLPEKWTTSSLFSSDLISIIQPGVPIFDKRNYLATGNINGAIIEEGDWVTYEARETRANMLPVENSVWFARMKNSVKHLTITKGDSWILKKYILSTGFCGLKCTSSSISYIHSIINSDEFEQIKNRLSHGATQEAVNNDDLKSILVINPEIEIMQKYNDIVLPLIKQMNNNRFENQKMIEIRNYLLPLIVNGQAKILS